MQTKRYQHNSGQVLVALLYIMVIGILVTTAAVYAVIGNTQATSVFEAGTLALSAAESGAENGLLRLVRNPAYTGETLVMSANQSSTVTVSSASGIVLTSQGTYGTVSKQIEVRLHYNGGELVVDSWRELP